MVAISIERKKKKDKRPPGFMGHFLSSCFEYTDKNTLAPYQTEMFRILLVFDLRYPLFGFNLSLRKGVKSP